MTSLTRTDQRRGDQIRGPLETSTTAEGHLVEQDEKLSAMPTSLQMLRSIYLLATPRLPAFSESRHSGPGYGQEP